MILYYIFIHNFNFIIIKILQQLNFLRKALTFYVKLKTKNLNRIYLVTNIIS